MESRKGDRLNKNEIHTDDLIRKNGYFVDQSDCIKTDSLLDDYVFSRDDVSLRDAAFLDAHMKICQECNAKYTELLQWKNLLTSAKYNAPENLRKSVMDYINKEHKKNLKRTSFKKNMFRFSAAAASLLMITVSVLIISIINKNPMSDSASTQNDIIMFSGALTEAAEALYEENPVMSDVSEADKVNENLDKSYSHFSFDNNTEKVDGDEAVVYILPDEEISVEAEAVMPDTPAEDGADTDPGMSAFIPENDEIAVDETEYEKRVAITSVASSPPPMTDGKQYIDSVFMLDYINIIMGEENVQKWLDEKILSKSFSEPESEKESESAPESAPEAETEQIPAVRPPLLYEAVAYFQIHQETLIALDQTCEGAEYYLGEDAIKSLYSQNWEALYKSETPSEAETSSEGE